MKKHYMLFIILGALFSGLGIGVNLCRMIPGLADGGLGWGFTILTFLAAFALANGVRIFKEENKK